MNIDYETLGMFLKANKNKLNAMTDKEFNDYINGMLDDFHHEDEENEQQ